MKDLWNASDIVMADGIRFSQAWDHYAAVIRGVLPGEMFIALKNSHVYTMPSLPVTLPFDRNNYTQEELNILEAYFILKGL
jgi:hypothetical protein